MKSFEARRPYNPSEQEDEKPPGIFEFSLEAEAGAADQEFYGTRRTLAEMLIRNPAFKSEKAQRALNKLREAWTAAEENLPEELKNELRHERRDAGTQDPVHISSIIADAPTRQPGLASLIPSESTEKETETEEVIPEESTLSDGPSIYRQAIVSGFATALVMLVIFMIFLLAG